MWILVISIIAFIIIMFIVNLIDKNKEKIIEKLKIEKMEIMKCPHCFREYNDLNFKKCKYCNIPLEKNVKYTLQKNLKKKICYTILGIIGIIVIGIGTYIGITNYKEEQKIKEKYNNDISTCYEFIKNESDFDGFKSILEEHKEDNTFENEAYSNLYKAIDERIENIKNGINDNKLITMLYDIKENYYLTDERQEKIEEKYLIANSYTHINESNKYIEEQKYQEAYDILITVINDNKDKNQDIVDLVSSKKNEIKDKAIEQVITKAKEQMNNKEYSEAQSTLSNYKDLGNQTILDMYNNATKEIDRIEKEKKAQEEAEEKARIKKERFDYEVYCYFNLIAVTQNLTSDDVAYSRCANKFGITKKQAKESYQTVNSKGGWWYQDEYPDIFEKYASQY